MHNAPAVNFPVGRSLFYGGLLAVLLVLGALLLVFWMVPMDHLALPHAVAALVWVVSAVGAAMLWRRSPVGTLTWDTKGWHWLQADGDTPVQVAVVLDLQNVLLLSISSANRHGWLWPQRSAMPTRWRALRCAVFSGKQVKAMPDPAGAQP